MAGTRSSTRNAGNGSSPPKKDDTAAGSKRKPETEPSPKRSRKATKKQATLEETGITKDEDSEMKDAGASDQGDKQSEPETANEQTPAEDDDKNATKDDNESASATKVDTNNNNDAKEEANDDDAEVDATNGDGAIEQSSQREKQIPSNILEKGLIYFFTRNRVGIDDADSVGDLQRTFFVLRPLPTGAKLGDGAIPDLKNNRLFALPKKTFPKSHNDRFMAFVEKANTTIQDLKDNFCKHVTLKTCQRSMR
jgi:cobalamin biosynthesis protein CobT